MAASLLLLHPPLLNGFSSLTRVSRIHVLFSPLNNSTSPKKYPITCALSSDSMFDREEQRWLREEQRWLREEKRWLREESRWNSERESLLLEIADLKLQIQALKKEKLSQESSIADLISNFTSLLQSLKDLDLKSANRIAVSQNQISDKALGSPVPFEEGVGVAAMEEVKEVVFEEVRVSEKPKNKRKSLRKGSEGEDVRAMQEALQKLGFYSGEEDMEYSSFSTGTDRAVKTWQDGVNGVAHAGAVASVTEVTEIQQTVVKETGVTEVGVSQHRVFLLGENRWEEPSRLAGRDKQLGGARADSATKCLACRGEGHILCTECDGTGEPNIEPQFLEWVDEGSKCPYCEGLGYTICDVCEGKSIITP